jgi:hypothetical protein
MWRRVCEHRVADRSERQVAEGAVSVPALVALLGNTTLGPCGRIDIGERFEPVDPPGPVARLAAAVSVGEVVGERRCVGLGEAERQ